MRAILFFSAVLWAGCLYDVDYEKSVSCSGHADCSEDTEVCGSVASAPYGKGCPGRTGYQGLDDDDFYAGGEQPDNQMSVFAACNFDTLFYPYCTYPDDRYCGDTRCHEGEICGVVIDDPVPRCVPANSEPIDCNLSSCTNNSRCVWLFLFAEEWLEDDRVACVDTNNIRPWP